MNNELIEKMAALRRDGFTMKIIAEACGVSERTARRWTRGVVPQIKTPAELNSDELTDSFYDQVLAYRRWIVSNASEHWSEPFELRLDAVDSAMKSLRELFEGMEKVSIRKLGAHESLRAEFFTEFIEQVGHNWIAELNTIRLWRRIVRQSRHGEPADHGDLRPDD